MKLKSYTDERGGSLIPIDLKSIPFKSKRCFVISDVPKGCVRGEHAHYETCQFFICVSGQIEMTLFDGKTEKNFILQSGESVVIDKLVWGRQKYLTGNETALVFCSTDYERKDYIEKVDEFNRIIGI
tara:strand:- start:281 stop:661 length:381 start_codon:yes stop_codon:yes gene_type:complete